MQEIAIITDCDCKGGISKFNLHLNVTILSKIIMYPSQLK